MFSNLDVDVALFCTHPRACLTANAVFGVRNRHHFIAHVIAVLVMTLKGLFYEFEDLPATSLIAAAAANALIDIDRIYKFRYPDFPAPSISYDCRHIVSFFSLFSILKLPTPDI